MGAGFNMDLKPPLYAGGTIFIILLGGVTPVGLKAAGFKLIPKVAWIGVAGAMSYTLISGLDILGSRHPQDKPRTHIIIGTGLTIYTLIATGSMYIVNK